MLWFPAVEADGVQGWVMYCSLSDNQIHAHLYADSALSWSRPPAEMCVVVLAVRGAAISQQWFFLCNSCFTEDSLECRSFHIFLFQKGKGWRRSIPIEGLHRAGRVNVSPGRLIFLLQFNWHLHYANLHGCWNGCKYYCLFSPISFNVLDRWFHQQH